MLCGTLLQRVGDVGAGDMSLIDPTSPFSIALSTFCMMLRSQQRIGRLYGVCSLSIAYGIWIDEMFFFLICFIVSAPTYDCASNRAHVQPRVASHQSYLQPWQLLSRHLHHKKVRLVETTSADRSITSSRCYLRDYRPNCF
jgi:hypothetical protein